MMTKTYFGKCRLSFPFVLLQLRLVNHTGTNSNTSPPSVKNFSKKYDETAIEDWRATKEENADLVESERFQLIRLLGSKLGRVGRGRGGSEGFLKK